MKIDKAELLHIDCMEYMSTLPDKAFDLAIVDPPYGIGMARGIEIGKWKRAIHETKDWDNCPPDASYFFELERISKNRIIWGGNYFIDNLSSTRCFLVWDKNNGTNPMADCELAWTSFGTSVRKFTRSHIDDHNEGVKRIHPTQKPVKLYEWILANYAKPGQRILDTHLGSGSSAIACNNLNYEIVGCELDADYYKAACQRVQKGTEEMRVFV